MKANQAQVEFIETAIDSELQRVNLTRLAICEIGDCWFLLIRYMCRFEQDPRPAEFGSIRDWKLNGLDDSHIETVFKKLVPKIR